MKAKTGSCEFLKRYRSEIGGVLGCYDRIVMTGTLLDVAYPEAVQKRLYECHLRCFELGEFAEPLREQVRANAEAVAQAAGLTIEYLDRKGERKGDRIFAFVSETREE